MESVSLTRNWKINLISSSEWTVFQANNTKEKNSNKETANKSHSRPPGFEVPLRKGKFNYSVFYFIHVGGIKIYRAKVVNNLKKNF